MGYSIKDTIVLIKGDFYRIHGRYLSLWSIILETILTRAKGQGWMFYFRLSQCKNPLLSFFGKIIKKHYSLKYCIDIPTCTQIGKGFYVGHGFCMVVHGNTIIGDNVNISQFVNIGTNDDSSAVIGDNVYIGPHVSIVGGVKIGNNVTIGAGAVVVKDIPDNATVVGVPARVVNVSDSCKYILNRVK